MREEQYSSVKFRQGTPNTYRLFEDTKSGLPYSSNFDK